MRQFDPSTDSLYARVTHASASDNPPADPPADAPADPPAEAPADAPADPQPAPGAPGEGDPVDGQ